MRSALGTLSRRRRLSAVVAALGGSILLGVPALAGATGLTSVPLPSVGSVTATINVTPPPVRSVTVTTATGSNSLTYGACSDASGNSTGGQLTLPNGACTLPAVTVTNGSLAGIIAVEGAPATPADGGTPWQPCEDPANQASGPGSALLCNGSAYFVNDQNPGQDQFQEATHSAGSGVPGIADILTEASCDFAFDPPSVTLTGLTATCTAGAGQSATENITLTGPSASTDPSSTFTTAVTWIAESA